MAKIVEHKNEQKVFMNKNEKFDVEKHKEELVERLTKISDEILSYDPQLVYADRPDLMYFEDEHLLWRVSSVKQLTEYDMFALRTILERRNQANQFNPYHGK